MNEENAREIRIGISSCLLGQKVRFDGNHKEQRLITETLAKRFRFVPICPEMAIGLGVPRTPIHLVGDNLKQRAVNVKDESIDVTDKLVQFGQTKAKELDGISGYIFKKASPSCGLFNVKIYKDKNHVLYSGRGLYAEQITAVNSLLPVEEEGRLNDPQLRHNFIQRVEVYFRWQQLIEQGITKKKLIDFHTRHKFMLLAHCESSYREAGRQIATINTADLQTNARQYITLMMEGLKKPASRGKHTNVLQHLAGFLKQYLDSEDKQEIQQLISRYRSGAVPRVVPLTILKHYLRKFPHQYLHQQYYLSEGFME